MAERTSRPGDQITKAAQNALCEGANTQDTGLRGQTPATENRPFPAIYATGAPPYRQAGWRGVLPLPPQRKSPPPKGFTGHDGVWPTDDQIAAWMREGPPNRNLMLRMEYGVIAIDVDAYGRKTGGITLAEAERRWGPLPATYRSTARRDDPISGQRLYRVPVGILFRDRITFDDAQCGDIEVVQPHHRFMVAWPSIHPTTGDVYRWYGPGGELLPEGVVPAVEQLPELSPEWIEGLARNALVDEVFDGSAPNRRKALRDRINQEIYNKLIGLQGDEENPESPVVARLNKALTDLISGSGSRYDSTRDHVAALMRLQAVGVRGVPRALRQLYPAYVLEVGDSRPHDVAEAEFLRFTHGAAMLIAATMPAHSRPDAGQGTTAAASEPDPLSWAPIDLAGVVAGDRSGVLPTLFERTDGMGLIYPGLTHSIHGESESGKSLIVQAECASLLNEGRPVLYLDFESDQQSVVDRLVQLGADPPAIPKLFHYLRPEVSPTSSATEHRAWEALLKNHYSLAVIDGVTEALTVFGMATKDNDNLAAWNREVPRMIADRTGAAVIVIDHVVKDKAARNRYAIGGQAKMAALTGAAYILEVREPLGHGLCGSVDLRIAKDRPGLIRPRCGTWHKGDRTQHAARIVLDATGGGTEVVINPPGADHRTFRPTCLMQRVSEVLERSPEPLTKTCAANQSPGQKQGKMVAFDLLVSEGYVVVDGAGGRGASLYRSCKPYRESEDPLSERFSSAEPDGPIRRYLRSIPGSGSYTEGTGEPVRNQFQEREGNL